MAPGKASGYAAVIEAVEYLLRAIELGAGTVRSGRGGPFGAVIVRGAAIIGEGANSVIALRDPTAHAEVQAIRDACARVRNFSLAGATLYASSEPCPMCLAAIYWARIESIVFASPRTAAARAGFDDSVFYDELAKDPAERAVPMRQLELPEGLALFDEWMAKGDKVRY
ncbi:MAG TPA: nucleoside deaminase [Polyangiaceae bacterium]|nr:nucleoside deaminase [Polyangiaceae bacterium]